MNVFPFMRMLAVIPYRYRVLALLCSLTTITYLDRICISIVGVRIKSEFHLDNEQFGWVLASFALAYALFEIPSGAMGDKFGPKAVLIRIVLIWSLFTALTGLATGLISLIIIRFLFGIGESGAYPNSVNVISRWFPANETARALTWVGIGSRLGSAIAPIIIIPLAVSFGWRAPFFVNAIIGTTWVIICYLWFKNFPSEMKHISEQEKQIIKNSSRFSSSQHFIPFKLIFSNRTLWILMLVSFCLQWANYFFIAWMPVYLQQGRRLTEAETKPVIFMLFIVGIIGYITGGILADYIVKRKNLRFGRRFIGMSGFGMCGLLLFFASVTSQNSIAISCLICANFFFSLGFLSCFGVCADIGRNNCGTVTGAMNCAGQLGAVFLAVIFGKMADATHNFNYPLIVVAGVSFIGCLLWLAIDPLQQLTVPIKEQKESVKNSFLTNG